jgi:citrate synthase
VKRDRRNRGFHETEKAGAFTFGYCVEHAGPDRGFGYDLPRELIGHVNLGDMGFLEIVGRLPTAAESKVFNALLVTLVEHGVTPSAIATRMTYAGAPESMQAAVAAGLLGLGTVFVGTIEGAARILSAAIPDPKAKVSLPALADRIVADHRQAKRPWPRGDGPRRRWTAAISLGLCLT